MKGEGCGSILEKMTLSELFSKVHIDCQDDRIVQGISDDSRKIQSDWVFVVRNEQGKVYIADALAKGAVVVQEDADERNDVYRVAHVEDILPVLLHVYYKDPWKDLLMVAVTGTNGKSSVSDILKQLLEKNGYFTMTIGTGQVVYPGHVDPIDNTTPSVFLLMRYFALAKELGLTAVIMEVSSHAIDQMRIRGICYDVVIYTNITQDHLDYHLTKTHYQYTKFKLRNALKEKGIIVLNNDDPVLETLYSLTEHKIITCGTSQAHVTICDVFLQAFGSRFRIDDKIFHTCLLSMANVYNITQALIVCRHLGISYEKLQRDVEGLHPVPGRLQCLPHTGYTVWIDYAHTYAAVKNIIDFANSVKEGNVILVVGCGGEREKEKRHMIGSYAETMCDHAIFTTDNPRHERPDKILIDMLPKRHAHIQVIENRWYAIKQAVNMAEKSDIIIIAGKGNEKTQSFMGREYPFHDEDCIYEIWKREELT